MHDEEQTAAQLKLPVLAVIPKVTVQKERASSRKSRTLSIASVRGSEGAPFHGFNLHGADAKLRTVISESLTYAGGAFRLISADLSLLQKQRGVKKILMLSAVPNEGKTFSACCLAAMLAQESRGKVLLIDADLKTGSASRMLGLNDQQMAGGLCAVLRGQANVEQSILKCAQLNLYFLPSGPSVGHSSEVLSSPDLEEVLREVSYRFDWVIVDSPPILVADAVYLLPHCDAALMVVRADQTPSKIIHDSIQRIGRERICGVLLNNVRAIKTTRYYQYYQKSYGIAGSSERLKR
jgi:capsular exopolysaccharide synthesis family protein